MDSPIRAIEKETCELGLSTITSNEESLNEDTFQEKEATTKSYDPEAHKHRGLFEAFKTDIKHVSLELHSQMYSKDELNISENSRVDRVSSSQSSELYADTQIVKEPGDSKFTDNKLSQGDCPNNQQTKNLSIIEEDEVKKELLNIRDKQNDAIETPALKLEEMMASYEKQDLQEHLDDDDDDNDDDDVGNSDTQNQNDNVINITEIPSSIANNDQPWLILSKYIDISLQKAVQSAIRISEKKIFTFHCALCSTVFTEQTYPRAKAHIGMERLGSHLNSAHLNNKLVIKTDTTEYKGSVTIIAVNVSNYNGHCLSTKCNEDYEKYTKILNVAQKKVRVIKEYLKDIADCLAIIQNKRVLCYKCYKCKVCYERLSLYVEHLKSKHHKKRYRLKIELEPLKGPFVNVIGYVKCNQKFQNFHLVSDQNLQYKCLYCKTLFDDKRLYTKHGMFSETLCPGCHCKFNCFHLEMHIGQCVKYLANVYPKSCLCCQTFGSYFELQEHQESCPMTLNNPDLSVLEFSCTVCPFIVSTQKVLLDHQVKRHTVPSDELVLRYHTPPETCKMCSFCGNGSDMTRHLLLKHNMGNMTNRCFVCLMKFESSSNFDSHMLESHDVRSDRLLWQSVSTCELCLGEYPGPVETHYCPKKKSTLECSYCHEAFQNYLFLSCHVKGQQSLQCDDCNKVVISCAIRAKKSAYCSRGFVLFVYVLCLHVTVKLDAMKSVEESMTEQLTVLRAKRGLIIDHTYAKKCIVTAEPKAKRMKTYHTDAKKCIVIGKPVSRITSGENGSRKPIKKTEVKYAEIKQKIDQRDGTEHVPGILDDDEETWSADEFENYALKDSEVVFESSTNKGTVDKVQRDTKVDVEYQETNVTGKPAFGIISEERGSRKPFKKTEVIHSEIKQEIDEIDVIEHVPGVLDEDEDTWSADECEHYALKDEVVSESSPNTSAVDRLQYDTNVIVQNIKTEVEIG